MTELNNFRIGASWYPEMWPESKWLEDLKLMKEIGFNITRLFEFAWHKFQPSPNKFNIDWAKKVMDLCHKTGIKVIIGTPTAAPPCWLTEKYPEVLRVNPEGKPHTHGARCHFSMTSPVYRELLSVIVEKIAKELGNHPALFAWQIDNEMGGADFSSFTRNLFHEFLKDKFKTIENLNKTWGLEFWSQAYSSFEAVPLPDLYNDNFNHHPSLIISAYEFFNDQWFSYIKLQCDIIRKFSHAPITTNMVGTALGGMDWFRINKLFDFVSTSMYKDFKHYPMNIPHLDRMRAEKPGVPCCIMETAPSWSGGKKIWNIHLTPSGVRAMTWKAFLSGVSTFLYWQWRQHWAGQEILHGTLLTATGNKSPNWNSIKQTVEELSRTSEWLIGNPVQRANIGLMVSNRASVCFKIMPMEGIDYFTEFFNLFFEPLFNAVYWRDVISEQADISTYDIIIVPLIPILEPETIRKIKDWVKNGGYLILGPLSGILTPEFTLPMDHTFNGLEEIIGGEADCCFTTQWTEDFSHIEFNDRTISKVKGYAYSFKPDKAKVLAKYKMGYCHNSPAILLNDFGKGKVLTLGCIISPDSFLKLLHKIASEKNIKAVAQTAGSVLVVPRANTQVKLTGYGIVNLTTTPRQIKLASKTKDLLTGKSVPKKFMLNPFEVKILSI